MDNFNIPNMTEAEECIMYIAAGIDLAATVGSFITMKKILKNLAGDSTSALQKLGINGMAFYISAKTCGHMSMTTIVGNSIKERKYEENK